jgi:hypothetical protein
MFAIIAGFYKPLTNDKEHASLASTMPLPLRLPSDKQANASLAST